MVVLAASIVTKSGKPLLSRQFVGLPRPRLESLLSSFPRLVSPTSEHTVVESSGVRFVYTPLEDLYVLLITNTQSNILLDLSTLSLITRIATELGSGGRGGAIGELDVIRVNFEILSAWDEVISLGWRENVNLPQVRNILEMESHEEKIQEIIARNKEHEAKEELKRRARQLEMQRREMTRRGQNPYANPSAPSSYSAVPSSYNPPSGGPSSYSAGTPYDSPSASTPTAKPFKGKGMQLGGAKGRKKDDDLAAALGGLSVDDADLPLLQHQQAQAQAAYAEPAQQQPQYAAPAAPVTPVKDANPFGEVEQREVHLTVREALSLALNRDGGISSLSLKGNLDLRISAPDYSAVVLRLPSPSSGAYAKAGDLQFQTHPNVDKAAWTQRGEVRLKEGKKGFPVGMGLGVLKWRLSGTDESIVPLSINCWPSADSGTLTVNLEYELQDPSLSLHNVVISIPLPPGAEPSISEAPAHGSYAINPHSGRLEWTLDEVSEAAGTASGNLEFEAQGDDADACFPVSIDFVSQRGICGVEVLGVSTSPTDSSDIDYSLDSLLAVDRYEVV
ncbi:coatomer subunit delta [Rhodotorula paludigena]|uniref:coatomer subunit delta n=1 Tax=Rhodotorula paludigena TaxID=86838 RepID=UPI00317F033A